MPKTYAQLQEQMEALRRQMEVAKRKEGTGVLKEIRKQVALYGFTPKDVFGGEQKATGRKASTSAVPKYQDGNGNSWSGRGPRPAWLRAALERGEALESFLLKPARKSSGVSDGTAPVPVKKGRAGVKTAAAKKTTARKTARGAKTSANRKAKDTTASRRAGVSSVASKQVRKRASVPLAPARPAAKKRRAAKASPARQDAHQTDAP
ncbi:H-NS family nucleoid-associated regulatory protein [Caldimonas brevitalea]|uniref:H-NS histone family protein n=1 Tax=Caldimonas brevitalea TaxID=413882 RepID=UPI0009FA63E9|nr:H-NS histone family protein [Caldimonas brevitalea]